jgi:hypothetical protein
MPQAVGGLASMGQAALDWAARPLAQRSQSDVEKEEAMTDEVPERAPEHDEKVEEKVDEKRDEKSPDEKWRRDRVGAATWAAVLIWIGVVLLLANLDLAARYPWWETWSVILVGVGAIFLVEVVVRLARPEHRRPVGGSIIIALVLIGVGLGELISWSLVWPVIVIAAGVAFLLRGLFVRR